MSVSKISAGYPAGSVINMATDELGRPVISISTLSLHTSDLQASSKCSITVTAGGFAVTLWQGIILALTMPTRTRILMSNKKMIIIKIRMAMIILL